MRGVVVVVVVDTLHHIFCFSYFCLLFPSFFPWPHGREQFPKESDSEEREREGVGISPHDSSKRASQSKHFTNITQQQIPLKVIG